MGPTTISSAAFTWFCTTATNVSPITLYDLYKPLGDHSSCRQTSAESACSGTSPRSVGDTPRNLYVNATYTTTQSKEQNAFRMSRLTVIVSLYEGKYLEGSEWVPSPRATHFFGIKGQQHFFVTIIY
uniref:Uncharacterized protein n=1 Tax=Sipha flava TaxID=143950 RepID=A0A2S2QBZ8_9HEMI